MMLKPKDAYNSRYETIPVKKSIGRIIAQNITPYPPCVPVLMAGEVIEDRHLGFLDEVVQVVISE